MLYTATVFKPSSLHALITRTAISPRFDMRTLLKAVTGSGLLPFLRELLHTAALRDVDDRLQGTNSPAWLPKKSVLSAAQGADGLMGGLGIDAALLPLGRHACTEHYGNEQACDCSIEYGRIAPFWVI